MEMKPQSQFPFNTHPPNLLTWTKNSKSLRPHFFFPVGSLGWWEEEMSEGLLNQKAERIVGIQHDLMRICM